MNITDLIDALTAVEDEDSEVVMVNEDGETVELANIQDEEEGTVVLVFADTDDEDEDDDEDE